MKLPQLWTWVSVSDLCLPAPSSLLTWGSWLCCLRLYTTTWLAVFVRSQGGEARGVSNWCSAVPASPTDASRDAGPEPAATVKSLIESFDTVGQSELWAPQTHPHTPPAQAAARLQGNRSAESTSLWGTHRLLHSIFIVCIYSHIDWILAVIGSYSGGRV